MSYGSQYGGSGVPALGSPPASTSYGNRPSTNALSNRIDVYRLLPTPLDADGGLTNTETLIFSALPCSVQPYDVSREERQAGPREVITYRITLGINPGILVGDQVRWVDDLGVLHFMSVSGTENLAGRGVAFYVYAEEVV